MIAGRLDPFCPFTTATMTSTWVNTDLDASPAI
jgi:ribosome modulation factor